MLKVYLPKQKMTRKHKKCSASLVIRELQIQKNRHHYLPLSWTKIFFLIHYIESCDCNTAGGKLNYYKFSGGQFGIMYIEPTVPFVDLHNEEVIGQ